MGLVQQSGEAEPDLRERISQGQNTFQVRSLAGPSDPFTLALGEHEVEKTVVGQI